MRKYSALIIADTGIAALPVGSLVDVVNANHIAFVSPTPTFDVQNEAGRFTVRAEQLRILSGAEAKAERAARKRARRGERLSKAADIVDDVLDRLPHWPGP